MTHERYQQAEARLQEAIDFVVGDIALHESPRASADVQVLTTLAEQLTTLIAAAQALEGWHRGIRQR